jgi:excisionase family DNA binding protein
MLTQSLITDIPLNQFREILADVVRIELEKVSSTHEKQVPQEELIKIEDVCRLFKVSKVTIHSWKKSGRLPFYRISNKIYFKKNEVIEAMNKIERRFR